MFLNRLIISLTGFLLLLLNTEKAGAQPVTFTAQEKHWADSVLNTLSLDEKIAQMMMVPAWSNTGPQHIAAMEDLILRYKIGGIIFFQGDPMTQAYQTNFYQQLSKIPMLISMDAEWGISMRLKTLEKFPFEITLGAGASDSQIYQTGYQMGLECRRMGIHMSYSPVADVNTNPKNPIIGFRSFGEDPKAVSRCIALFTKGMQDAGIIACAKHFPGHGDSEMDSHNDMPVISHSRTRLDTLELLPFKEAIKSNVQSIMVAHLSVPSIDPSWKRPASLSPLVIKRLLKDSLGFKGLVITDAMNMQGISKYYKPGIAEAEAVAAGNDILCLPADVPLAIATIKKYLKKGKIEVEQINASALKILLYKAHLNLYDKQYINTQNLYQDLGQINSTSLKTAIAENTVTLVTNKKQLIPADPENFYQAAHWHISNNPANDSFTNGLGKAIGLFQYHNALDAEKVNFSAIANELSKYKNVVVSVHSSRIWGNRATTLTVELGRALEKLDSSTNLIVCVFGNFYLLRELNKISTVLIGSEDQTEWHKKALSVLLGKTTAKGHLPVSAGASFPVGTGLSNPLIKPFHFATQTPLEAGFKADFSTKINAIMNQCISAGAAPGGQVLVLRNGKNVFNEAYGRFTYDSTSSRVLINDMYDLASVSKMAGTTLAAMRLYENGLLNLDTPIGHYIPEFAATNKGCLTARELLLHEAGLVPWIPFYKEALSKGNVFSATYDSFHTMQIANKCFMYPAYRDTIWKEILESPVNKKGQYLYSDLSMLLLQRVIEKLTALPLNLYLERNFYKPLGLKRTGYTPALNKEPWICPPTSNDLTFRNGLVQGFVHDPAAAMLGGVCGHAGLFSNSRELGTIMQMLLDSGRFNGLQFFKPSTVETFTCKQNQHSHRGLGFDKPYGYNTTPNVSKLVPPEMFGHSGFTGTWAWADPKNKIVVVILTNRTFPTDNNRKLIDLSIRGQIIDAVYGSL